MNAPSLVSPPAIITTTADLTRVCQAFATAKHLAVDTEFMRESTYYPQLCLIQLATPELAVAIDPLAPNISLAPLTQLFANSAITKVFHAAKQDLQIFFHLNGTLPTPIYDTQIAGMVCGLGDQVGYDKLVHSILEVTIDKTSRFTDWARRPLSPQQLKYALADVVHLTRAYPILRERIAKAGREDWLREEMAELKDMKHYQTKPRDAWLRFKQKINKAEALNRLRHLAAWREEVAQTRDMPRSWLLKDEALLAIANLRPRNLTALGEIRGINSRAVKADGNAILAVLGRAEAEDKSLWPRPTRRRQKPPPQAAYDLLRVLLQHKAEALGIAPRLLASTSDLEAMARRHHYQQNQQNNIGANEAGENEETPPLALQGWRYEVFGKYALELLDGKIAMTLVDDATDGKRIACVTHTKTTKTTKATKA
ncbi:MAG: ribonuclease D [Proteobacteria bacterium]|nr:ribonuclease D [Pseudomonadota bacterium]